MIQNDQSYHFLTQLFSHSTAKELEKGRHFLPITFRLPAKKDRLYDPDRQENVLFAARKRIVSGVPEMRRFCISSVDMREWL
jgi:hypothetical protein